ncbi:MAG: hypothetical protein AAGF12_07510 [Myxococcota bacterium]
MRFTATFALAISTLAVPHLALSDTALAARVCLDTDPQSSPAGAHGLGNLNAPAFSFAELPVTPFFAESDATFSWSPTEAEPISDELSGGMSGISLAEPTPTPAHDPTPVLWCASPDDPRCSPVPVVPDSYPNIGSYPLRGPTPEDVSVDADFGAHLTFTNAKLLDFAAGVSTSLDRPPQRVRPA